MAQHEYKLQIKQHDGIVSAFYGEQLIAEGGNVNVLRETRLGDYYYFPKDAITPGLLSRSDHQTFCPFKGTATYWDMNIAGEFIKNAAWSYETPLSDSIAIGGQVSFGSKAVNNYQTNAPAPILDKYDDNIASPLSDWIIRQAPSITTRREFIKAFGNKLVESGIAVYRLRILLWSLHPQIAGVNFQWMRDSDEVEISEPGHGVFVNPAYINSPVNLVSKGLGGVRQSLKGDNTEFEFSIMNDLKAEGATDYVAMPLRFSDGQFNCMTITSDHEDGFTTANLGLIFECVGVISRYLEVMTLRSNTTTLLNTYLGERSGQKVLAGDIQRGKGENIEAVILFSDMRNSTGLAEKLPRDEYLQLLNEYFETVLTPVKENGGEVLKFIGDAVLAIFPIGEGDRKQQTVNALNAAMSAVEKLQDESSNPNIDLGISLHIGEVTYGNVGGLDRLDFTVTGPAVNLASRIESLCKSSGNRILISQDFKQCLPDATKEGADIVCIGEHEFAGVSGQQMIYSLGSGS